MTQKHQSGFPFTKDLSTLPGKVHKGELFAVQVQDHTDTTGKSGAKFITIWSEDDGMWSADISFASCYLPELETLLRKARNP